MLREFKEFAARGSMLDMAVGIVIGAAFATIVGSLVNDIIMPPIGLALGGVDFADLFVVLQQGDPAGPYATVAAAQEAGAVTVNWGVFVNSLVSFVIIAFALFLVVKGFNEMQRRREEPEEPAAESPPEPSAEERLLTEIRDLLRARA